MQSKTKNTYITMENIIKFNKKHKKTQKNIKKNKKNKQLTNYVK